MSVMAKKSIQKAAKTRPLTIWDGEKYFDATFTEEERGALRDKLMDVCGYGENTRLGTNFIGFEHDIERPAQDEIWPAFRAQGFDYHRDGERFYDYGLIHICRQLQIEYKSFAKNVPKLSITGFIQCAKRTFPEFRKPRNKIEYKIQEHKLHLLWCDWHNEECVRTGCNNGSHWLCSDRFAKRDYAAILEQIAKYNETRPKLIAAGTGSAVRAEKPKRQKPVLRIAVNNA